ncbi:MAG: nitrous oxide reductase accessory protein NosL [Ottowia sp.]|nr:nitrous oxide reductase accessory protein NosL [Ottowia sp.]
MRNVKSVFRRLCLKLAMAALAVCAAPAWAQADGSAAAPQAVPAEARCPVCGMYPARYPKWAAQLRYSDGERRYFDSPVEMLRFLADVPRYDKAHTAADVQGRWLSDASGSGQWIAFENAWVVYGSGVSGPMHASELPAFASEEAAQQFAREHGGHAVKAVELPPEVQHSLINQGGGRKHGHASAPAHEHGHAHNKP